MVFTHNDRLTVRKHSKSSNLHSGANVNRVESVKKIPGFGMDPDHRWHNFLSRLWNSLPVQLCNPDISYGLFRRQLKGHLFWEPWTLWCSVTLICDALEEHLLTYSKIASTVSCPNVAFSALTQEEHPACKNWVMRYWNGYLSGARYKWFAYGPTYASGLAFLMPAYPDCPGKEATKWVSVCLFPLLMPTHSENSCKTICNILNNHTHISKACWPLSIPHQIPWHFQCQWW